MPDPHQTPAHPAAFSPVLNAFGTLMLVLSAITPASSVFIIVPGVIALAGSGAFLSFAAAAVIGLFLAFVYAELSSAYPTAGSEYTMVGQTLGRFWGFVTFVLMFVTIALILAIIARGTGTYLGVIVTGLPPPMVGVAAIAAAAVVAVLKVNVSAFVTGIFLAIELLGLIVLTVCGFVNVERPFGSLVTAPQLLDAAGNALAPASAGIIMAATSVALFAYGGYGGAAAFGEETRNAKRNIGKVVLWALCITVVVEIVPLIALLLGAPDLKALIAAPRKIEYFLEARGGRTLTVWVSLAIAVSIFNAVIAILLLGARILFSSGRDKIWIGPVSAAMSAIHPRFKSPWVATVSVAVLSSAACFIDIKRLLVVTGTSLIAVYALLCIAAIAGRRNGTTDGGHYRMPFFPWPAVAGLATLGYIVYQNLLDAAFGRTSLIATGLLMLLAAIYYVVFLARREDWKLHSPAEVID